jgi:hypothetical protein
MNSGILWPAGEINRVIGMACRAYGARFLEPEFLSAAMMTLEEAQ